MWLCLVLLVRARNICPTRLAPDRLSAWGSGRSGCFNGRANFVCFIIRRQVKQTLGRPFEKVGIMETRKAKLPDGSLVIWHMFFTDADGDPMALVEMAGGNVRTVHATWVEFQSAQQGVHLTPRLRRHNRTNHKGAAQVSLAVGQKRDKNEMC